MLTLAYSNHLERMTRIACVQQAQCLSQHIAHTHTHTYTYTCTCSLTRSPPATHPTLQATFDSWTSILDMVNKIDMDPEVHPIKAGDVCCPASVGNVWIYCVALSMGLIFTNLILGVLVESVTAHSARMAKAEEEAQAAAAVAAARAEAETADEAPASLEDVVWNVNTQADAPEASSAGGRSVVQLQASSSANEGKPVELATRKPVGEAARREHEAKVRKEVEAEVEALRAAVRVMQKAHLAAEGALGRIDCLLLQ